MKQIIFWIMAIAGACHAQKTMKDCARQVQDQFNITSFVTPEQIQAYFDCFDVDFSGGLDLAELENGTDAALQQMDANGDGTVDPGEFDSKLSVQVSSSSVTTAPFLAAIAAVLVGSLV